MVIEAAIGIGWVVSPVISLVINKIETNIEKKYFKNSETEKYFKEMKTSLREISSIMARVEQQRIEKHEDAQLVQEIKDAVYDAEDVVNDFEYNLLDEEKSVEQQKIGSAAAASGSSFLQGAMSVYEEFTKKGKEFSEYLDWPILGDGEFKKKVIEVGASLVRAKESAQILLNIDTSNSLKSFKQENESPTSSQIIEEIFGRTEEQERLINLLLEENEGRPTIIQIDGQGGIGKSTLARLVYNDSKVTDPGEKGYFDQPMWLYVSENFDMLRLTKQMLKYFSPNFSTSDTSFDLLQTELEEKLASNKILLVLDDVWYVKDDNKKSSYEEDWLQFLAPLKNAKAGSKIIVTAREGVVYRIWESFGSVKTISLGGLNADDSWLLLKSKAFGRREVHKNLEQIGKELVKNLKGLPLAIRVVGTELWGESDTEEWERILNDKAFDKSDIKGILLRSYEHLVEHLRRCFAYCSLFPKGYYLKPDRLVQMWIAQGFVHPQERKSSDKIGKSYFNELIDRSFIQVIKQGYKKYYVMHDLMNDLACHVSQGECYILKEGDTMENLGSIRHLSVTTIEAYDHLIKNIHGLDKLRTLILPSDSRFSGTVLSGEVSIKMKRIRVLDIDWCFQMLPNIGECKHLRYLCFRNCRSKLAPDSFSKLHLLTVLFIRRGEFRQKGHYFELSLPQGICSMSRLEFIDISKSNKMDLGGQVQLYSLWRGGSAFFYVQEKKGWELSHLRDFNNIKGMLIIGSLENVASGKEAIEAQLDSKEHVIELRLCWSNSTSVVKSNKHNEVLEALRPHPNIERLEIIGFPGDKWPSWLESNWLSRMTYIEIGGRTSGVKRLPALGQLSQLKKVKIRGTTTVRRIGDEFYGNGTFPSLEKLEIDSMEGLEEWLFPCGVQSFPNLRDLLIKDCPRFVVGPEWDIFPSLEKLVIRRIGAVIIKAQLKGYGCLPALTKMEIADCKGSITLEGWDELVSLKFLEIEECPDLLHLPEMEFFYSLRNLEIGDCPKLRSLPKNGLPVSLQWLDMATLHPDLEKQLRNENGREWDKVAAISGCHCTIYANNEQYVLPYMIRDIYI